MDARHVRAPPRQLGGDHSLSSRPAASVATYELVADLPLEVEGYELEGRQLAFGPDLARLTTGVRLLGGGEQGLGEDVVYDGSDHLSFRASGSSLPLAGSYTIDSFSRRLDELDLFPEPPVHDFSIHYRRWAFESAALDLALRQAGKPLHEVLGREPRPVTFLVSTRLQPYGEEGFETPDRVIDLLARYPGMRFKLDPTKGWGPSLVVALEATGAIDSLDLKGFYSGTPVDVETDPELYRLVVDTFRDAWFEDPDISDETRAIIEPIKDRITWDAPIHGVADIEALEWKPRMINIKPSRFGPLRSLFDTYDYCEREDIDCYGGGQTELGAGRGQIQYLASLFHPDGPNDVAPSRFNQPLIPDGLPTSPLEPAPSPTGFRWGESPEARRVRVLGSRALEGDQGREMEDQNTEVVRGIYEAFGRGDVPNVLGAMSDDVEWHAAEGLPFGGVHRGRDAIVQGVFGPLMANIPDFSINPEQFLASGDTVASIVNYKGTGNATGKQLDLQVVHVWNVRDGKIARIRQFIDTAKFLEVMPTV
jgi:ketosteroid isomerase-like protein